MTSGRIRLAAAVATLAFLVWQLGTGPFLDGLHAVDAGALAAASALAVATTVCCAWRWRTVARGLGAELPLGTAVAAYYRSLFLNVTLPGGVVGDVHRGFSHGLRAVVWERSAGQVVQAVLTVAVLLVLPSPVRPAVPYVALALLAAAAGFALALRLRPGAGPAWWVRLRSDVRAGLLARRAWPAVALASALVVAGHALTFLIAARTAGVTRAGVRAAGLGAARAARRGAPERRRLGAARGRHRVGVRRRRPGRLARGHHRRRVRRDGGRRDPAGSGRARGGLAVPEGRACLTARTPC